MSKKFEFIFVCSLILALELVYVFGYYGRPKTCSACDAADPTPLRRIDLNMIKGTWKCKRNKIAKGFPIEEILISYDLVIGTPFANGSAAGETKGRSPVNCECFNDPLLMDFTGVKNFYREISSFSKSLKSGIAEWRFLDLIGPHLLAQECIEFDTNGRCTNFFLDIFSRTADDIPLDVLKRLNQSARKTLCVDIFEDLLQWPRGTDCPASVRSDQRSYQNQW